MTLYRILLWLVHCILTLYYFILYYLEHLKLTLKSFLRCSHTLNRLKSDSRSLKKLPIHIGFVTVENDISYTDIASLIVWCVAMGISCISVYDKEGIFKRNEVNLHKEILKKQQELLGDANKKYNIVVHNGSANSGDCTPGASGTSPVHLCLLSSDDGRQDITSAAQVLCQAVAKKQYRITDIQTNSFSHFLKATQGLPDPDLVIHLGSVQSVMGYIPWQICLSEILSLPTHHNVQYDNFLSVLKQFANCQQRFGK